jgi:hypothetical protein
LSGLFRPFKVERILVKPRAKLIAYELIEPTFNRSTPVENNLSDDKKRLAVLNYLLKEIRAELHKQNPNHREISAMIDKTLLVVK